MLTLTPVPLNQVLKRKARMIGNISTIGKGRWVDQDASMLAVPGQQVYQYDSSSETEDEIQRRGGEILGKLMKPSSPTDTMKRLASAKRRDTPGSPKSPKKSQQIEEEEDNDSTRRIKSKIRATGQVSLGLSPSRKSRDDLTEDSEEDGMKRSPNSKSATKRKMRAVGTIKAALSPHKSPSKKKSPGSIRRTFRAIASITRIFRPRPTTSEEEEEEEEEEYDEDGNIISPRRDITQESSPSSVGSIFRKIKILTRLSPSRAPDASPSTSSVTSMMTRLRFITKISPRRRKTDSIEEEPPPSSIPSMMTRLRFITKISPRRKKNKSIEEDEEEESKKGKQEKPEKSDKEEKETEDEDKDKETVGEVGAKQSCFGQCFKCFCPCIARKKEPELMEYQSGSEAEF